MTKNSMKVAHWAVKPNPLGYINVMITIAETPTFIKHAEKLLAGLNGKTC